MTNQLEYMKDVLTHLNIEIKVLEENLEFLKTCQQHYVEKIDLIIKENSKEFISSV